MHRRDALRRILGFTALLPLGAPDVARQISGRTTLAADPISPAPQGLEPFRIEFGEERIDDIRRRIDDARWPEMPFETGWEAGTDVTVLRELVQYWRHGYDWFRIQEELNTLEHLRGPVDGELLHCVRYRGEGPGPRSALILLHGWPSSFLEFRDAARLLTREAAGAAGFDVVVPSLPGFVFSEAPRRPGMNPGLMADRLHRLMLDLGYERYGVHGGDWGSIIGTEIARRNPESVFGLHLNFVAAAPPPPDGTPPSEAERAYRERRARFQAEEAGYSAIQGTRPQTLSYAQQDSPVGWLAWILEKYWAWGDHRGDLWSTFRRDDILTTAMLYWLPGRILSAARLYYETSYRPQPVGPRGRVEVPTGYSHFPAEPWGPPPEVVERTYNLVHFTEHERGGHFPALEQPGAWSADVARFFRSLA
jgi:epoxide hydrolase